MQSLAKGIYFQILTFTFIRHTVGEIDVFQTWKNFGSIMEWKQKKMCVQAVYKSRPGVPVWPTLPDVQLAALYA